MPRRDRLIALAVLGALINCKKNGQEAAVVPAAADGARASDAAVVVAPMSPEDVVRRYEQCWSYYNAAKWDAFKACHAPDAEFDLRGLDNWWLDVETKLTDLKRLGIVAPGDRAELELVLAIEGAAVGIVRMVGVEAGRPVQLRIGQRVRYDATGRIEADFLFFDAASKSPAEAQVPARVVVIPKYIDAEEENNIVVERLLEAFSYGKLDALGELLADDVTWTDHGLHRVMKKVAFLAYVRDWQGMHPRYALDMGHSSFGGDVVAVTGTLKGEIGEEYAKKIAAKPTVNEISIPVLGVFEVRGGKVTRAELFWQSAALQQQLGVQASPAPPPP